MSCARNRIRIFYWQLETMPKYNTTLPTETTPWKMWKRDAHVLDRRALRGTRLTIDPKWFVGQYYPIDDPDRIGIRWFEVVLLEGPMPPDYRTPDWDNKLWRELHRAEKVRCVRCGLLEADPGDCGPRLCPRCAQQIETRWRLLTWLADGEKPLTEDDLEAVRREWVR